MGKTICMLVYDYYPAITGGAEKQCRLQAHELARRGYSCLVIAARTQLEFSRREVDHGCQILRCFVPQALLRDPSGGGGNWESGAKKCDNGAVSSRRMVEKGMVDLLRWLNIAFFMVGASIALWRRRKQIYIIHTHIASWNAGFAGWIGNLLGIPALVKAAYLPAFVGIRGVPFAGLLRRWRLRTSYIALTPAMADDIAGQGIPRANITVIHNGVDIPAASVQPDRNEVVLCVGNFTQGASHKAFDVLINAWSVVHSQLPSARLVVAGAGDAATWRSLAAQSGCESSIEFPGYVVDMAALYGRAGFLVLPSRGEGISNALLEAQAYGLPAVVSDIPGNREVVVDGKTGMIVPVNDYAALADAILRLCRAPELRGEMGRAAREHIQKEFAAGVVVDKICALYDKILETKTTTGH